MEQRNRLLAALPADEYRRLTLVGLSSLFGGGLEQLETVAQVPGSGASCAIHATLRSGCG